MKTNLLSIALLFAASSAYCTVVTVTNTGFAFTPATVTITAGDSVNFAIAPEHDAREVSKPTWDANGTTPSGGFEVPFGGGMVLPAQLPVGTHWYVCIAHASFGMKGIIIVESNNTGIPKNSLLPQLSPYPNPSHGKFYISNDELPSANLNCNIYNLNGEKIFHSKIQNIKSEIDISDQPAGIYFIDIYNENAVLNKRSAIIKN